MNPHASLSRLLPPVVARPAAPTAAVGRTHPPEVGSGACRHVGMGNGGGGFSTAPMCGERAVAADAATAAAAAAAAEEVPDPGVQPSVSWPPERRGEHGPEARTRLGEHGPEHAAPGGCPGPFIGESTACNGGRVDASEAACVETVSPPGGAVITAARRGDARAGAMGGAGMTRDPCSDAATAPAPAVVPGPPAAIISAVTVAEAAAVGSAVKPHGGSPVADCIVGGPAAGGAARSAAGRAGDDTPGTGDKGEQGRWADAVAKDGQGGPVYGCCPDVGGAPAGAGSGRRAEGGGRAPVTGRPAESDADRSLVEGGPAVTPSAGRGESWARSCGEAEADGARSNCCGGGCC